MACCKNPSTTCVCWLALLPLVLRVVVGMMLMMLVVVLLVLGPVWLCVCVCLFIKLEEKMWGK